MEAGPFRVVGNPACSEWFPVLTANRWNIRRAPAGTLPPWRSGEPDAEVLAGEDGQVRGEWAARWWVFPPGSGQPCAMTSGRDSAQLQIDDALRVNAVRGGDSSAPLVSRQDAETRSPRGRGPGRAGDEL
ncbi:hypothetical protein [Mycolicibacterium sp.]|uniref:hypothetical protein n=1 Tax=Mycolicibacterium sp. TaxID=2320850 RepID=UPI0037C8C227